MMKNRENIERWVAMTDEDLLSLAEASKVEVPCEFAGRLDSLVTRLDAEERQEIKGQRRLENLRVRRTRIFAFAGLGLAAASLAALLVFRVPSSQPKDTFSSPEEAYAMLESTFLHIASTTGAATLTLGVSVQRVEDTINEVYR